jgi:hypothetical protein
MVEEQSAPRLLPLTVALSVLLWIVVTTGGRQIFVKEVLGEAYDSQAEHLLHGDPGVDVEAIRWEAMIVNGKVRMYFGPFPAFLRIPLNLIYPAGRGAWSRVSGFFAGVIALVSVAGLVSAGLRTSPLSARARGWLANALLVGFVLGSLLLFLLGNLSIYSEAIIWGLAWSLAALFFAERCRIAQGRALTFALIGFSVCAGCALLSRVTFGAALILVAPVLALRITRENRLLNFAALMGPLSGGIVFHLLLNYGRFGSFLGASYDFYINSAHRDFAHRHGIFNLSRFPYSFADYFGSALPSFHSAPPLITVDRHPISHPALFSLPISETFISLPWCSGWLVLAAIMGIACLFRRNQSDYFQRWIAAALFTQFICILTYFALAQRYAADLYPFLIFCLVVFLANGQSMLLRLRHVLIALIAVSIVINSLATAFWLAADSNLPAETRNFWAVIAGTAPASVR